MSENSADTQKDNNKTGSGESNDYLWSPSSNFETIIQEHAGFKVIVGK